MNKNIDACFSHKSDEWETPKDLYNRLNEKYNFNLDLYASQSNHLCDLYFTIDSPLCEENKHLINGFRIYANPPYSKLGECIKTCYELSKNNFVVMLIPARTDTIAFHKYIYNNENCKYEFIKGRLKFSLNGQLGRNAPFPSMLVYMGVNNG